MHICATQYVRICGNHCEPSCIYDCRHRVKSFGSCVLIFLCSSQGRVLSWSCHLVCWIKGWVWKSVSFQSHLPCRCSRKSFSASAHRLYCKVCMHVSARICMWVLGSVPGLRKRPAQTPGMKIRELAATFWQGWTAWKRLYWVKYRIVWNYQLCVSSVTRQTRH